MDAKHKIERYNGCDWTDVAYRLGYTDPSCDEDCWRFIESYDDLDGLEDALRAHLVAMLSNHSDNTLGHEKPVWDAILNIPHREPAFIRLAFPLIKYMWV